MKQPLTGFDHRKLHDSDSGTYQCIVWQLLCAWRARKPDPLLLFVCAAHSRLLLLPSSTQKLGICSQFLETIAQPLWNVPVSRMALKNWLVLVKAKALFFPKAFEERNTGTSRNTFEGLAVDGAANLTRFVCRVALQEFALQAFGTRHQGVHRATRSYNSMLYDAWEASWCQTGWRTMSGFGEALPHVPHIR